MAMAEASFQALTLKLELIMPYTNVSHFICSILLSKYIKTPFLETPNLKVPRLSSSAMTSPASPASLVHREVLPQRHAVQITVDTLNCYHTCSITHLHFSSAITLMSAHTLERHPAQSCLSVCFSLPHIPIHTDIEPFCRSDHCFILCHSRIVVCAGSMLIC